MTLNDAPTLIALAAIFGIYLTVRHGRKSQQKKAERLRRRWPQDLS